MAFQQTLILLPLLLSVGVFWTVHALKDEDRPTFQPFVSNSQKRRICVDLCLAGLGGSPCGEECMDLIPQDLPIQPVFNETAIKIDDKQITRHGSCNVLCKNNLGSPLCVCGNADMSNTDKSKSDTADFVQICGEFCFKYEYRIPGCQKCNVYKNYYHQGDTDAFSQQSLMSNYRDVDWDAWCQRMCGKGDGGAACNCDRLPI